MRLSLESGYQAGSKFMLPRIFKYSMRIGEAVCTKIMYKKGKFDFSLWDGRPDASVLADT